MMNEGGRLLEEQLLAPATPVPSHSSSRIYTPLRYFFSRDQERTNESHNTDGDNDDVHESHRPPHVVIPSGSRLPRLNDTENDDDDDEPLVVDEIIPPDEEDVNQRLILRILGRPYANDWSFWCEAWPRSIILGFLLSLAMLGLFGSLDRLTKLWFSVDDLSLLDPHRHPRGEWKWLIITSSGGLLSGLVLLLPGSPRLGAVRTMFHDASDLKGNPVEAPFVVAACFVALVTGAPLGPEMALGAVGSGLASGIARCKNSNSSASYRRRLEAACVVSGMAGALGALFPSPLLGILLVYELSVSSRPAGTTLDQVVSSSTAPRDGDSMEQLTLMGTAATVSYVVLRLVVPPANLPWSSALDFGADYEMWHLAAAIPVGLLCGLLGSLMMILLGLFRSVRRLTCRALQERFGFPLWAGRLLFPLVAGVLHGLMALHNPFLVGSGAHLFGTLISGSTQLSPGWFSKTALCKVLSLSLSIGFGLVGGPLIPMAYVGLCSGLAMSTLLPVAMSVPCCICAVVCSFVPIPFTAVFTVTLGFSLSCEQVGPVFVSIFVAYTLTGGLGIIRKLGEKRLGYTGGATPEDLDGHSWIGDESEYWYRKLPSDNSVVRGVRSTIFGHMI